MLHAHLYVHFCNLLEAPLSNNPARMKKKIFGSVSFYQAKKSWLLKNKLFVLDSKKRDHADFVHIGCVMVKACVYRVLNNMCKCKFTHKEGKATVENNLSLVSYIYMHLSLLVHPTGCHQRCKQCWPLSQQLKTQAIYHLGHQ